MQEEARNCMVVDMRQAVQPAHAVRAASLPLSWVAASQTRNSWGRMGCISRRRYREAQSAPNRNQSPVAKLTASPMEKPCEKPAW